MTTYSEFKVALAARESGGLGDFKAENNGHYIGRYQFSEILLADIGFYQKSGSLNNDWTGTWTAASGVSSKDEFMGIGAFDTIAGHANAIAAQEAAIEAEFQLNGGRILAGIDGWWVYEGQVLNGSTLTFSGMLAYSHLIGYTAFTQQFLKSGGVDDPKDGNQIKGSQYLTQFAGYDVPFVVDHSKNETIKGGAGNDILTGGKGKDNLTGGLGNDIFVINTGDGIDTILDREPLDRIVFNGTALEGAATSLGNGKYSLNGATLQQSGLDPTANDNCFYGIFFHAMVA